MKLKWVDCRDSEDWHSSFRWFLCQQYDADDEIWNMLFSVCERSTSEHNWRGRKTRWYVFHDDAETVDWFPKGKLTDDQVKATALAIWRTRDQSRFPYPSE